MGRASIDQITVGFRVAFESVRQGRCEAPAARRMMQVVLLTSLVSEAAMDYRPGDGGRSRKCAVPRF